MAPRNVNGSSAKKFFNKGSWTTEEDRKLAQHIEIYGAKKWKTVATKSDLNRCGKSCRLRWLNYLRPNIKRGNISDEEEDLILRLHRLLGNRWSLIAGRLPGRTDNEIKNYWNSHLSKKINKRERTPAKSTDQERMPQKKTNDVEIEKEGDKGKGKRNENENGNGDAEGNFDVNELFDFSTEGTYGLDWVNEFLELDEDRWITEKG